MKRFKHAALGGTFDHLHAGHKKLIDETFLRAEKVSVGLTTNEFVVNKALSVTIQSWEKRLEVFKTYLKGKNLLAQADFFHLTDIYGTTLTDSTFDSIFVTPDTHKNALAINKSRRSKNLSVLEIIVVPLVKSTDGKIISSDRIRAGEIDRAGDLYFDLFQKDLELPHALREDLRKPLGEVVGEAEDFKQTTPQVIKRLRNVNPPFVIAVGDIIARELRAYGKAANIEIIDLKTKREHLSTKGHLQSSAVKVKNESGTIGFEFVEKYKTAINRLIASGETCQLLVEGEEDLTALPAILLAPLYSVVLYGQFDLGVVLVEVTEEKKEEVGKIITQFKH